LQQLPAIFIRNHKRGGRSAGHRSLSMGQSQAKVKLFMRHYTRRSAMARKLPPIHPGEILKETLDDLGISMNRLAQALHVPANRISNIVAGQRGISGETALRFARYFNTTPDYWISMQAQYDLETARDEWDAKIRSEVRPRYAA
ncbi:MAG: HigA family addiction module antitoxin, partial [Bryobacteraceae bacterium]